VFLALELVKENLYFRQISRVCILPSKLVQSSDVSVNNFPQELFRKRTG